MVDPDIVQAPWRVHTVKLLAEVLTNPSCGILHKPLVIFDDLLHAVAARAIELNDPELNRLMVRLTLYSVADPNSPDYNPAVVESILTA